MTRVRGIWKTGALAVVATLIFASIVFLAAERFGRSGDGGVTIRIVPQIVAGSYDGGLTQYKTTIEIVNTGGSSVTVSGNFYDTDGVASTLLKTTNLPSAPAVTAALDSIALAAQSVLLITAENASIENPAGKTGWARIVVSGRAAVSASVELRDARTGVLYNRVGIPSSPPDMASFSIPWIRDVRAGLDTGFAIVNTGTTGANLNGTVRNAQGMVIAAQTIALPAGGHTSTFAGQFFSSAGCSPCLTSDTPGAAAVEPSGVTYGSLTFVSTSAQFAATGLAVEGAALSTAPVERLR